jgi:hypothetical protein
MTLTDYRTWRSWKDSLEQAMPRAAHIDDRLIEGWRCSSCGELITRVQDGWVEWLAGEDARGAERLRGLRLVHKMPECQYDEHQEFRNDQSIVEGLPLERFVGPDGLMLLLSFLASGDFPRDEVLELIKRVQIPYYEQASRSTHEALELGVLIPAIGQGYYLQSEMRLVLGWARSNESVFKK